MNNSITRANPGLQSLDVHEPQVQQGLILIPDISGYSEFVEHTDIVLGRHIVYRLLSAIIKTNRLGLNISEIEGDAVLFYKYGQPPSVRSVLDQFERMLKAFNEVLAHIHPGPAGLSLKMIAHYGPMAEFLIHPFRKLYGETVTVAHRLLKNSVDSRCYVLMTDDLIAAGGEEASAPANGRAASQMCDISGNRRKVCFSYFDYEKEIAPF